MPRSLPLALSAVAAIAAAAGAFEMVPRVTQPVRTNVISDTLPVVIETPAGVVEVDVELLAISETRSLLAVEIPYVERAETTLHLADALPPEIDGTALNDAAEEAVRARTADSWNMDDLPIPYLVTGETTAVASARQWHTSGLIVNFGGLALLGVLAGAIVHAAITRIGKRRVAIADTVPTHMGH